MRIKFAISIGNNCKPRYQLDRFMFHHFPKFRRTAFFFDWLMGGELSGVINIIERGFLLKNEDIFIDDNNGKFIPRDKNSGFSFLHDFGTQHRHWETYEDCEAALNLSIDKSLEKYKYLALKTNQLLASNLNVGLLYYGSEQQNKFSLLQEILVKKYNKKFILLNVLEEGTLPSVINGSVQNLFVNDSSSPKNGSPLEWEGCDQSWHQALSQIPYDWLSHRYSQNTP